MKRIIALTLSLILILGTLGTSVFVTAEDNEAVNIRVETVDAVNGGKEIPVKLFVTEEPHFGALQFELNFNPEQLTYKYFELNEEALMRVVYGNTYVMANEDNAEKGQVVLALSSIDTEDGYEGYHAGGYDWLCTLYFDVSEECTDGLSGINVTATECVVATGEGNTLANVETNCVPGGINVMTNYCDVYGHKWNDWILVTDPTCSSPGIEQRVCSRTHNHVETREVWSTEIPGDMDKDGNVTVADALAALRIAAKLTAETEEDLKTGDMDGDKAVTVADALAILRIAAKLAPVEINDNLHLWGEWVLVEEPTCCTPGTEERVCLYNPEHKQQRKTKINANAHVWGEWQETKKANCTTKGEETRVCLNDPTHKQVRATPIDPDEHNFYLAGQQSPWCTIEGYDVYVCRRCEYEKWIYYPMAPHNYIKIGEQAPTETEDGYIKYMCLDCFNEKTEIIPKLGS